ncbi:class I SAM-dependent methyltransferase [Niallia sp. FSL M8-0099]|uniref:class I SAM-dependent methyltransferase n=1 Tax=Niallia sp. FSL M8-0099 TaxID=2954519 RepID=UPI0030F995D6
MFKENHDFYPTPEKLIQKMLFKLEWKNIKSVLEPSAGMGHLAEAIDNKFRNSQYHHKRNKYDIDLIEIDENLIHILKGKGYRVIHNDFLSFQSFKKYDAIIANFPFSNGEKHVLQAIEILKSGGELVCLINKETLINPYSNTRKDLIRKLEEYNAEVEYIDNAFSDALRKTDVSVALIHISIPKVIHTSLIENNLKQEESYNIKEDYKNTNLIESDFIRGIVQQYNYEIKAGLKLIEEYNSLVPLMLSSFKENSNPVLKLGLDYEDKDGSSLENSYIKRIRAKYWQALFNNEQFMGLFTSNLRQKYMQQIEELKDYDFSFYNIYSLRIELNKEMIQGVEDTILNLFEEFSYKHYYDESSKNVHLYNGWKTNKAYKINKKVIIPLNGYYDILYSWGRYNPSNYKVKDKLKDIEKVFNYLDGGITQEIDLEQVLKDAETREQTKKIETKYFYITFFKKGTCHIEFKNLELLQKFNLYGSQRKGWIPPSYGKKSYKDMTQEEKSVIDSFEGKTSYEKVMNNKEYFLVETSDLLRLTS